MKEQPTALRLAQALNNRQECEDEAADELRRLVAQRDALLEACKALLPVLDKAWNFDGDVFGRLHNDAVDADAQVRATIKAVEESK